MALPDPRSHRISLDEAAAQGDLLAASEVIRQGYGQCNK